jgi:hypothetical protein
MARARVRLEEINNSLGEADERQATKLRAEVVKLQQDLQSAAELERGLRKAAGAQSDIVGAHRELLQRQRAEAAFHAWSERLSQMEKWLSEIDPIHPVAYKLGIGGERTKDAFTGASLAFCPSASQLLQWRTMTDLLKVRLREAGYSV